MSGGRSGRPKPAAKAKVTSERVSEARQVARSDSCASSRQIVEHGADKYEGISDPDEILNGFDEDGVPTDVDFYDDRVIDYSVAIAKNSAVNNRVATWLSVSGFSILAGASPVIDERNSDRDCLSPTFDPHGERCLTFGRWSASNQTFDRNVFIKFRPVNPFSSTDQPPSRPFLLSAMDEAGIPRQRCGNRACSCSSPTARCKSRAAGW